MTSYQDCTNRSLPPGNAPLASLPVGTGQSLSLLPVGTNSQVLTADSTQTLGVKWATPTATSSAASVIPNYYQTAIPKWSNTRQVNLPNYFVADSTGSVYISNTSAMNIDLSLTNQSGGIYTTAPLAGTIQVNRNNISGIGTQFTTQFLVGDTIYLPSCGESRKITQIYNNVEMLTDPSDNWTVADWASFGAVLNTTTSKFGGSSVYFNGSSYAEMVYYGSTNSIHQYEFTMEGWFNFPSFPTGTSSSFNLFNGLASYTFALYVNNAQKIFLNLSSAATSYDISSGTLGTTVLTTNTWNHIALTYYYGVYTVWLNGKAEITISNLTPITTTAFNAMRFGASEGTVSQYSICYMDEFRVSGCCRYMSAFTPATAAFTTDAYTILLNHFDGTSNSTLFNPSEVIRPTPVRWDNTIFGSTTISSAQSKFGGYSCAFNGANGVNLNTGLSTGNMPATHTLEYFIYFTTVPTNSTYVLFNTANTGYVYNSNLANGKFTFSIGNNGTSSNIAAATGTTTITAGNWYHYALTYDGSTYRQFVNGVLDASVASTTATTTTWAKVINFGSYASTIATLSGFIDEIRFSNIARYTAAFTAPTAAFTLDANTISLNHMDAPNTASTFIQDGEVANPPLSFCRGGLARLTHFYPYAISNGTNSAIMLSHRCASFGDYLDLPSGYTYYRQLKFSIATNIRSNIAKFVIAGNFVTYPQITDATNNAIGFVSDYSILSYGAAGSFSALSCINLIPKISQIGFIGASLYSNQNNQIQLKVRATGDTVFPNGVGIVQVPSANANTNGDRAGQNDSFVPLNNLQQFDYMIPSVSGNTNASFYVRGYQITEI